MVSDPEGGILAGGFVNFDSTGHLSNQAIQIFFDAASGKLRSQTATESAGHAGVLGVGDELVHEFYARQTARAIIAFGPIVPKGVDPTTDAALLRKAIQFAIDNSTGVDKTLLGGAIDIAIMRKNRTIEWVSRKPWCSKQDQRPLQPHPRKPGKP